MSENLIALLVELAIFATCIGIIANDLIIT